MTASILTINVGSSTIKFSVFSGKGDPEKLLSGMIDRIGQKNSALTVTDRDGVAIRKDCSNSLNYEGAAKRLMDVLDELGHLSELAAVGHRVVHGGKLYRETTVVDAELVQELHCLSPIDPNHLPGEIALIEFLQNRFPELPQLACFDTAFHRSLPTNATLLPIPRHYANKGIQRFGFHGLSYAYLLEELKKRDRTAASGRLIFAHLGSGASMAAVRDGVCVDTTMAFTPTAGLVMGTRTGDLDPGVLIYLMRQECLGLDEIDELVNHQSGLRGISATSSDMRELIERSRDDPKAAEAVSLFCYQAKKWIGALSAALGGVDTLVFSGGIGENSAETRHGICHGLEYLGIELDADKNRAGEELISSGSSPAMVRVIPTNEELMIAREVARFLALEQGQPDSC
ncbi:MAG: acetate kinase [Planctomyces sp.]|nr:acetate kinase [Planctomyces sp.]